MVTTTGRSAHRDAGSPALFGRAVGATAAWLVAFGVVAIAHGWSAAGAIAVVAGLTAGVVTAATVLSHPEDTEDTEDTKDFARTRRPARWAGLNDQRNGYGPPI
jgi:hypothetical protein